MPKPYTFPTLLNELKQISISDLKRNGYLEIGGCKSGRLIWRNRGEEIGSINIYASMKDKPFVVLSYTYNKEESVKYEIELASIPSNLGVGKIWYFVCPNTEKKCRKLYSASKYFLHRDAFPKAMYECQTYSKYERYINNVIKVMYGVDELYEELYSKHFKSHYAGKPTRRYKKIMSELDFLRQNQEQAFKIFQRELNK